METLAILLTIGSATWVIWGVLMRIVRALEASLAMSMGAQRNSIALLIESIEAANEQNLFLQRIASALEKYAATPPAETIDKGGFADYLARSVNPVTGADASAIGAELDAAQAHPSFATRPFDPANDPSDRADVREAIEDAGKPGA